MEPIYLAFDMRLVDYDRVQYAIEHMTVNKKTGKEVWTAGSFYISPKQAASGARRRFADREASIARSEAEDRFDASTLKEQILALPEKE